MRTRHHSECHRSRPRLVGRGRESPHSLGDGNRERQCAIHGYGRAGNILAKCLTFLAGADAAGIVLGAKVPVILTSRADFPHYETSFVRRGLAPRACAPIFSSGCERLKRDACLPRAQFRVVEPAVPGL